MSYREYEAIVLPVSYNHTTKDVERFLKAVNEKRFRFFYLDDYNIFVHNPSVKNLKRGDGWTYVSRVRVEKGANWYPNIQRLDRELSDLELLQMTKDLGDAPEIYKKAFWARIEVIESKVSFSK